jgi:hypothetical protein
VSADPKRVCQYRRLRRRNYLKNPPRTIGFKRKFAPTSLAVGRKNTFLRLVGLGLAERTGAEMIGAEVVEDGGLPEAGRASADRGSGDLALADPSLSFRTFSAAARKCSSKSSKKASALRGRL